MTLFLSALLLAFTISPLRSSVFALGLLPNQCFCFASADILPRQSLLHTERRPHALPQTLPLPVRSLPHHGLLPPAPTEHIHMGRPPLLKTSPASPRWPSKTIRRPPLVFLRPTQLSIGHPFPRSIRL